MPLSSGDLTEKLWAVYGPPKDKDENTVAPTKIIKAFAEGVVQMMKAGLVSGSVTGTGISGNMVPGMQEIVATLVGGKISALMGATIYAKVYPVVEAEINKINPPTQMKTRAIMDAKKRVKSESDIISAHIMSNAVITFPSVKGKCTAFWMPPPPAALGPQPGTLLLGNASDGKMIGLNGEAIASLVAAAHGVELTETMKKMYTVMVNYIMENIKMDFPVGTVQGVFAPPPAPMVPIPIIGGIATGALIS